MAYRFSSIIILGIAAVAGLFLNCAAQDVKIHCKDENGQNVDWFVAYKLPKLETSDNPNYKEGSGYSYITPDSTEWTESEKSINDPTSIVGNTLKPLFRKDSTLASVVYNDQPPVGSTVFDGGHTKGVILSKNDGGIWLVHSVPHFPDTSKSTYSYPHTGLRNAQAFLCLNLNLTQIDAGVGPLLLITRPNVFNFAIPPRLRQLLPTLGKVVKKHRAGPPYFKLAQLQAGSLNFFIFAKGPKFQKEIYMDWIGPKLQSELEVQSWLNGPNPYPSNCTAQYPVHNIIQKNLDQELFSTHSDHSKWAVGTNESHPWICIGDLNRMEHQRVRGGGVLCTLHAPLWSAFKGVITEVQPCPASP